MLFHQLFKFYIRQILECNVSACMPYQAGDVRKIKYAQATFTRLVWRKLNIKYESYKHGPSFFNFDTLEIRRIKYDLILIFKTIHNLIDLQFDDFFFISPSFKLYQLRRHKLHLNKPVPSATLIRVSFFLYQATSLWNQLPSDIVMSEPLGLFKKKLNHYSFAKIAIFKLRIVLYLIILWFYALFHSYML